jgi:hypothetical protein
MTRNPLSLIPLLLALAACTSVPKQTPVQIGEMLKTGSVRVG